MVVFVEYLFSVRFFIKGFKYILLIFIIYF